MATAMITNWIARLLGIPNRWLRPPLICTAPMPRLVPTPTTVAKIVIASTMFPAMPFILSPNRGLSVTEMSVFSFFRKRK